MDPEKSMSEALQMAVFAFSVDKVTAEVSSALEQESIPAVVLKGPGIATWLYTGDEPRLYNDSDLLLRQRDWERGIAVVKDLGFEDDLGPLDHPRMESGAGYPWVRRADGGAADLHYTLFGVGAEPEVLWEAIWSDAVREVVGGAEVSLPSHPALLLHICLHAVQHGGNTGKGWQKPMRDLRQALIRAPEETWREALELAERVDAAGTFAMGLRFLPEGRETGERIGATHSPGTNAALRLSEAPLAEGFQELSEASGLRARLEIVLRELIPTPTFMRWWSPLARQGKVGLALAYLWRPIYLISRAIPGYRAWRQASRESREAGHS